MKIRIFIKKKEGVLDVEGRAIQDALLHQNFKEIKGVTKGMFVDIEVEKVADVALYVQKMCESLLVNDVIESYEYQVL